MKKSRKYKAPQTKSMGCAKDAAILEFMMAA